MKDLVPTHPVVPAFTPVPRKYRYDGWTPERQKAFIDALAETGSVKAAALRVNMSKEGAYYLRRQPHADEFRVGDAAGCRGQAARSGGRARPRRHALGGYRALRFACKSLSLDGERALEGVAWPVFGANGQIGERRLYKRASQPCRGHGEKRAAC